MDLAQLYSSSYESCSESEEEYLRKRHGNRPKKGNVVVLPLAESPTDIFERNAPHVRGNWSGHVFAPLEGLCTSEWQKQVDLSVETFRGQLEKVGWSGTLFSHSCNALHISISRPFSLQLANIESFQREVGESLSHERHMTLRVESQVVLSNDTNTRTFFGWKLAYSRYLHRIVNLVDDVMLRYKQESYYDPPLFHITLASIPAGMHEEDLSEIKEMLDGGETVDSTVEVHTIRCTFGASKQFTFPLTSY